MIKKLGVLKFWIKYWTVRYLLYIFVLPKYASGAEVGVREGNNAKLLYKLTKPQALFLADNYQEEGTSTVLQDGYYHKLKDWCKDKRATLFKLNSYGASQVFPKLDWVYIDADHTDLYNDLLYWYPKVKEGGIIMGDDYNCPHWMEVTRDVKRFCKERNIKLKTLHQQWWFRK